ncbi:hypothetical protein R6Q59_034239 [Mikania micrantha]
MFLSLHHLTAKHPGKVSIVVKACSFLFRDQCLSLTSDTLIDTRILPVDLALTSPSKNTSCSSTCSLAPNPLYTVPQFQPNPNSTSLQTFARYNFRLHYLNLKLLRLQLHRPP